MDVEVFPFPHHSTSNKKFSSKLLSFEEIGYTVATRRISVILFIKNKATYFPIVKVKCLNICGALRWVPIMQLYAALLRDVSP
jgi:hypothetical protein